MQRTRHSFATPTSSPMVQNNQPKPYHFASRSPDQPLGFSFGGGGWFMVYMYGVAKALREHGLHKSSRFIGTSAGCLSIIAMVGESDFDAVLETIVTSYVPQAHGSLTGPFKMREYLVDAITRHTNLDNVPKLNDRCTVVYTSLSAWEPRKVSQFRDFDHLLWTMVASCCATPLVGLPFKHEGEWVIDGGIMENQPEFADVLDYDDEDDNAKQQSSKAGKIQPLETVTVSPNIFSGADIRPSRYVPAWWSMYPPSERDMRWLYDLGYEDALQWIVREEAVADSDKIEIPTRAATYDGQWKTVVGQAVGYRWVEDKALMAVDLLHLSKKTTASTFLRAELTAWKLLAALSAAIDRLAFVWILLAASSVLALVLLDQHYTLEFALVTASHLSVAVMRLSAALSQVDNSEQWQTVQASIMLLATPSAKGRKSCYDARGRSRSASKLLTPEQHNVLVESSYIYRMSSSFI